MNYTKIYESLVNKAKERQLTVYTERHHIIPRCIGGTDNIDNIIRLTPEEHYVAHQLLIKIYPNESRLVLAARYMTNGNKKNGGRINNKMYGWLKRLFSETMRNLNIGRTQSEETRKKRSEATKGIKRKPLSKESIEKRTATRKANGSGTSKRRPRTNAEKKKLSDANKGRIPTNKGTPHTAENKKKISAALLNMPPLICPHCGKQSKSSVMYRWHFDNCKFIRIH